MRKISSRRTTRPNPDIPPEISQFIKGRSVRVAEPTRYLAKHWQLQVPFLGQEIKEIKPNVFQLEPETFGRFMSALRSILAAKNKQAYAEFRPSDWIAFALLGACSLEDAPVPSELFPNLEEDWRVVNLPIENAVQEATGATAEGSDHRSVMMTVGFEQEPDFDDFSLVIRIMGEPLSVFEEVWESDQPSPKGRLTHKRAERLWHLLSRAIAGRLGLKTAKRGRPMRNAGRSAAFGHDHRRWTWQRVARDLCPEKHMHGPLCRDNYRKQASQYWERERKRYAALAQDPSASVDDEQEDPGPGAAGA
jgi:hypothetical protein